MKRVDIHSKSSFNLTRSKEAIKRGANKNENFNDRG
jgi:hypothetical protein